MNLDDEAVYALDVVVRLTGVDAERFSNIRNRASSAPCPRPEKPNNSTKTRCGLCGNSNTSAVPAA